MPNPLVPQGTLNRILASLTIPFNTGLNVTAPFLGPDGIGIAFQGDITGVLPQMTGVVTSPEPYQIATILIRLIRAQPLADAYKQQLETLSTIGDITVRPDTRTLSPYQVYNCSITHVGDLTFNGRDAGYGVSITGAYQVNSSMFG